MTQTFLRSSRPLRIALGAAAAGVLTLFQPAYLIAGAGGAAHAQAAVRQTFTVKDVRPEAYSWYWDNLDAGLFTGAHGGNRSIQWVEAPSSPQHLGYSAGARYQSVEIFGGATHNVEVSYLEPSAVRGRVASDNYLGAKPYSFVAQRVSIDGRAPFTLLVQYLPTGKAFGDTAFSIEATSAADAALAQSYVEQVARTLKGLGPTLNTALSERYFNAVLKKRGSYKIGPVDKNLNITLTIVQEIKGITPQMLNWWWDHIGNTERYRLWQPVDHVSFEWTIPPFEPDLHYDVGARQRVKEYIGKSAYMLDITGADPAAKPYPPLPLTDPDYFYARTDLTLLAGILPSNSLVHQWRANAAGDGVVLTSTFVNTSLALVLDGGFFENLGSHALREFQMLPYFLPRLYRREQLGE